jgi:hypothetical protein
MRTLALGHVPFAIGLAGLGILSLASGDFAFTWQRSEWVIWRSGLAHISGLVVLGIGIGMLVKRTARLNALVATIYLAIWVLMLQSPRVARAL